MLAAAPLPPIFSMKIFNTLVGSPSLKSNPVVLPTSSKLDARLRYWPTSGFCGSIFTALSARASRTKLARERAISWPMILRACAFAGWAAKAGVPAGRSFLSRPSTRAIFLL